MNKKIAGNLKALVETTAISMGHKISWDRDGRHCKCACGADGWINPHSGGYGGAVTSDYSYCKLRDTQCPQGDTRDYTGL